MDLFIALLISRITSALLCPITDCDEVFNFWEPAHFFHYGYGFEPWEYSAQYGLRSYLYLQLHVWVGNLIRLLPLEKTVVFFVMRVAIALWACFAENMFLQGVRKLFGDRIATLTCLFSIFAPGMYVASAAFLPSSFAMTCVMLSLGLWFRRSAASVPALIFAAAAAVVVGWPFCGLIWLPVALHVLVSYGLLRPLISAVLSVGVLCGASYLLDSHYYGRPTLAVWNLVQYNVFGTIAGSDKVSSTLYGVEPWSFFFKNLTLNFNVAFLLALVSPLAALVPLLPIGNSKTPGRLGPRPFVFLTPFYIWFVFWLFPPHKEERFMSPIYPGICLGAAVTVNFAVERIILPVFPRNAGLRIARLFIYVLLLFVYIPLCCGRFVAITSYYNAPFKAYRDLNAHYRGLVASQQVASNLKMRVCVGKEWYRFPSHYFLDQQLEVGFIRSGFKGLLPTKFSATSAVHEYLNPHNREVEALYIPVTDCDYIVDRYFPSQVEEKYHMDRDTWDVLAEYPFLDAPASPLVTRTLYIPRLSAEKNVYNPYFVLKRRVPANSS
eukprot:TRINITY_DN7480_c0_g1_i1.p1 TRINITY_DN7480_c0_g1~~TRINITY_DN7480_c0_g1_i1.p1  ORF type:complete len:559 (+),score=81.10 TRINITY_DN7480_c0_g1_i1:27-1679(+)